MRAQALRDLDAGRKLARAKEWTGALAAFDRALAVTPDDARVLSEVGWAALQANDLKRAETANARALANAKDPALRAPILYNVGRVAEAKGDSPAARRAYAASLALRENAEVRRRLSLVAADSAAVATGAGTPDLGLPAACVGAFPDANALCKCLLAAAPDDGLFPPDGRRTCSREATSGSLDDPRLSATLWGSEMGGESAHLLLAREGTTTRAVAVLGRDYEPGAFGVHNSAHVGKGTHRDVAGHRVVVVSSFQSDNDTNMAGLELCIHHAKQETVCALGDAPGATRCTPPIPLEVESGCGPNPDIDPRDVDEDARAVLAEAKKTGSKRSAKTSWTLGDDGIVDVRLESGSRDLVEASIFARHVLWR